jgi:hypothetical protein
MDGGSGWGMVEGEVQPVQGRSRLTLLLRETRYHSG